MTVVTTIVYLYIGNYENPARASSKFLLLRIRLTIINWTELSTAVTMRISWREFTCLENRLQQPMPPQNFTPKGQR